MRARAVSVLGHPACVLLQASAKERRMKITFCSATLAIGLSCLVLACGASPTPAEPVADDETEAVTADARVQNGWATVTVACGGSATVKIPKAELARAPHQDIRVYPGNVKGRCPKWPFPAVKPGEANWANSTPPLKASTYQYTDSQNKPIPVQQRQYDPSSSNANWKTEKLDGKPGIGFCGATGATPYCGYKSEKDACEASAKKLAEQGKFGVKWLPLEIDPDQYKIRSSNAATTEPRYLGPLKPCCRPPSSGVDECKKLYPDRPGCFESRQLYPNNICEEWTVPGRESRCPTYATKEAACRASLYPGEIAEGYRFAGDVTYLGAMHLQCRVRTDDFLTKVSRDVIISTLFEQCASEYYKLNIYSNPGKCVLAHPDPNDKKGMCAETTDRDGKPLTGRLPPLTGEGKNDVFKVVEGKYDQDIEVRSKQNGIPIDSQTKDWGHGPEDATYCPLPGKWNITHDPASPSWPKPLVARDLTKPWWSINHGPESGPITLTIERSESGCVPGTTDSFTVKLLPQTR